MKVYQERIKSFVEVKNRTMHLGNTEYTYDSTLGKYANRAILIVMEIIQLIMPMIR